MDIQKRVELLAIAGGSGWVLNQSRREAIGAAVEAVSDLEMRVGMMQKEAEQHIKERRRLTKALEDSETRERNSQRQAQDARQQTLAAQRQMTEKATYAQQLISQLREEREEVGNVNDKLRDEIADLAHKLGQLGEQYNNSQDLIMQLEKDKDTLQEDYNKAALRAVTAEGELAEVKERLAQAETTEQELQKVSVDFVTLQGKMQELFVDIQEMVKRKVTEAVIEAFAEYIKE